ncbi:MAG TPA: SH3 domain-containing protein, partial [Aggregatilineales bacterium]|nr:SH3 domain-containing protein [Aggregatilineales bacterium]
QVENRVTGEAPTIVPTAITITASDRVNVRSGAGRNFNSLGTVDSNSTQTATGVSEDGEWVRISFAETDGWISRSLMEAQDETAFNSLPVVTEDPQSPMQAFYFTTGAGNPTCKQAPDAIVIQSPERLSVNVNINGATVKIGSTIVLTTQLGDTSPDDDLDDDCRRTEAIVLDGGLEVNGGGLKIPIGHFAFFTACLDGDGSVIPQDDWENGGIVPEERLAEFAILEDLPEGFLHYPIRIPTREEIEEALRPAPTEVPQETEVVATSTPEVTSGVDCSGFFAVSPLESIPWGVQEFRWSPARGAEFYYFTLVRADRTVGSVFISQVGGTAESVFADVGIGSLYQVGRALNLKWQVEAWTKDEGGNYYKACSTEAIPVRRSVPSFDDICAQLGGVVPTPNECRAPGGEEIVIPA